MTSREKRLYWGCAIVVGLMLVATWFILKAPTPQDSPQECQKAGGVWVDSKTNAFDGCMFTHIKR
ncbi:hypothetical protein SEA_BILLNYE_212 [Streptomyces phage BillNye]|uniref:Uncharacterized protein n=1 Tax=Streptomyces phage BillNye TaxID=2079426 RepID=A0A2L1IW95_9CAUD|nr:hypothetical protein FDJ30_gp050 [Streptomyces phage BillNye]AVD99383.1 hypothetical protein SEA_BILLNYE_212 [Streptomyces phage BillNye]